MELGRDFDPRVGRRLGALFDGMVRERSVVLRRICPSRCEEVAAQRFLSSPQVTVSDIFEAGSVGTVRASQGRRVVVAQDTTEVSFARALRRRGLGPGGDGRTPGFFLHALLAVDAQDEAVLGPVGGMIWTRDQEPVSDRKSRAFDKRESRKWTFGAEEAAARLKGAGQIILACDQEGDIWETFVRCPASVTPLVRAQHDRTLAEKGPSLFELPRAWLERARYDISISPRKVGEKARQATIAVKAGAVVIRRPKTTQEGPPTLALNLVEAMEVSPTPTNAPVRWRLLTTLPIDTAQDVQEVVRLYKLRWRIEEAFRLLKKDGVGLEETQVQDLEHLFRVTAIALAAAIQVLQLVDARDGGPRPMSDLLDPSLIPAVAHIGRKLEGATQRQKNPHPEGSLAWLSWIVARHGGWKIYGKPPGPKTMAYGVQSFMSVLRGYLTATGQLP